MAWVRSQAQHTAMVVNEVSDSIRGVLEQHPINKQRQVEGLNPANVVLLRGCGKR
jgi:2,3-bisphosphoglycerate-independent phosphoglycerate mutase